jgi:hypothetical protein
MPTSYIQKLERDWKCAEHHYLEVSAAAQKVCDEYDILSALKNAIQNYQDKAEATKGLIEGLKSFLKSFAEFIDEVFLENLKESGKAVVILVKSVKCLSYQVEEVRRQLRALLEMIDCLNNPALSRDTGIMKCLVDLLAKTEASIEANLKAIKAVLELLKQIVELRYHHYHLVETREGSHSGSEDPEIGILADLRRLLRLLNCTACGDSVDGLYFENRLCPRENTLTGDLPCRIPAKPFPVKMPEQPTLCAEESAYLTELSSLLAAARAHTESSKCLKEHFEEKKKQAKATLDALKAALDAAKAVKDKCK